MEVGTLDAEFRIREKNRSPELRLLAGESGVTFVRVFEKKLMRLSGGWRSQPAGNLRRQVSNRANVPWNRRRCAVPGLWSER
jgi:hypothetical protein